MIFRLLGMGTMALAAAALAGCGAADDPASSGEEPVAQKGMLLARYRARVRFDDHGVASITHAPTYVAVAGSDPNAAPTLDPGRSPQVDQDVFAGISLTGPGVWDAGTEVLTADTRITSTSTTLPFTGNLDEPRIVITRLCDTAAPPNVMTCTSCTPSELVDGTCIANPAVLPGVTFLDVHVGSGRPPGSHYAFADVEAGVNAESTHQFMRIRSIGGVPFDFSYEVRADPAVTGPDLDGDEDDDTYNEDVGEDAGDDCDDTDPAINPAATEICDGQDNDCVNGIDQEINLSGCVGHNFDGDLDGFGDPLGATACYCLGFAPPVFSATADDCCDSDPGVNPGAPFSSTPSFCGGFDMNCDTATVPLFGVANGGCDASCGLTAGWVGPTVPACGVTASFNAFCSGVPGSCTPIIVSRTQQCQ